MLASVNLLLVGLAVFLVTDAWSQRRLMSSAERRATQATAELDAFKLAVEKTSTQTALEAEAKQVHRGDELEKELNDDAKHADRPGTGVEQLHELVATDRGDAGK